MPPASAASDAALVERARADREAFALLYARDLRPIYRYCDHRLGDAEAAEDATSQTFARALAALPTCDPESFRAWPFAIAHNVVSDRFQFRHAHPAQLLEAASHRRAARADRAITAALPGLRAMRAGPTTLVHGRGWHASRGGAGRRRDP